MSDFRQLRLRLDEIVEGPQQQDPGNLRGGLDDALTQTCKEMLVPLGMQALADRVEVYWNRRLRTTAGLADSRVSRISLNPRLERFQPEEPMQTLKHELAHLIAHERAGDRKIRPHGPEWQKACRELGIGGEERCHDLPFEGARMKRNYAYQCIHCLAVITRVRKLKASSACYSCCKKHNQSRFSTEYLMEPIPLPEVCR